MSSHSELLTRLPSPEPVQSWGGKHCTHSVVLRPVDVGELRAVLDAASATGYRVGLRGAGCSYGDASCNDRQLLIELSEFNQLREWDAASGRIRVQPGVTLEQLWKKTLPDGWWPPVVTGTMRTTVGGCLAMNTHGKNNWKVGGFGEHVAEFELLTVDGSLLTCSPFENSDLFEAVIGGLGLLGIVVSATLQLKPVETGLLRVTSAAGGSLSELLELLNAHSESADYAVGWVDCLAGGSGLGRGQVHAARHLQLSEVSGELCLDVPSQTGSSRLFGVIPRAQAWRLARPLLNEPAMRLVNLAKWAGARIRDHRPFIQPLAQFHFLLDSLPGWKRAYGPDGLIQYQVFVPAGEAEKVFRSLLAMQQSRGLPSFLGVLKKHRRDRFLLSHGVDGFSLAMDFPARRRTWDRLCRMIRDMDQIVVAAGGRFYFAKDQLLQPESAERSLGAESVQRFLQLKRRWDSDAVLQTDLWRRVLAPIQARANQGSGTQLAAPKP